MSMPTLLCLPLKLTQNLSTNYYSFITVISACSFFTISIIQRQGEIVFVFAVGEGDTTVTQLQRKAKKRLFSTKAFVKYYGVSTKSVGTPEDKNNTQAERKENCKLL